MNNKLTIEQQDLIIKREYSKNKIRFLNNAIHDGCLTIKEMEQANLDIRNLESDIEEFNDELGL